MVAAAGAGMRSASGVWVRLPAPHSSAPCDHSSTTALHCLQLPLDLLNAVLASVHGAAAQRSSGAWWLCCRAAGGGSARAGRLHGSASSCPGSLASGPLCPPNHHPLPAGFTLADVEDAGMGAKAKVVLNSLVKLNRAQLRVGPAGTVYLLV